MSFGTTVPIHLWELYTGSIILPWSQSASWTWALFFCFFSTVKVKSHAPLATVSSYSCSYNVTMDVLTAITELLLILKKMSKFDDCEAKSEFLRFCKIGTLSSMVICHRVLPWPLCSVTEAVRRGEIKGTKQVNWVQVVIGDIRCNFVLVAMLASWSVHHSDPDRNSSTNIRWIAMEFCTDIHGPQRMNLCDFGVPLSFPLAPSWGWHFCFWVKYVKLFDGLEWNLQQIFKVIRE